MTMLSKVVSALSFAHLSAAARPVVARAADDDKPAERNREDTNAQRAEKREDETDDQYAKRMKVEDESSDEDSKKAETEDEKEKAEDDKPDEGDDKKCEDDDKDEEMKGASAVARGRLREQARCASIFASQAAARNPVLAANLAFKTRMSRAEALSLLEATPGAAALGNAARSARNPNVSTGGSAQPTSAQASATAWDRAFKAVAPRR